MARSAITSVLLLVNLAVPLLAQDEGLFFDTVDVYVVNVEILVTDKDGNPATGLRREDFRVYEDGKRVELTNFFAVEGRRGVLTGEAAESARAPETQRLNLVVLVDNLNMAPENRNPIFRNLREYLQQQLDPRDRVMLVTMNDTIEVVQGFTNDVPLLLGTLDRLDKQLGSYGRLGSQQSMVQRRIQRADLPPNPANTSDPLRANRADYESAQHEARSVSDDIVNLAEARTQLVRASAKAIAGFTDSLAGMKGRKAILYVSDGLPIRPADALVQAWLNKFGEWIMLQDVRGMSDVQSRMTTLVGSSRYDTSSQLDELAAVASANQVAFYPLSNGGRMTRGGAISAEVSGSGTASGQGAYSQDVAALASLSLEGSLLQLAEKTGGLAFTRSANIGGLLERLSRDFDSFYSLGYSPPHRADEEFHQVEVKVDRPDLLVRHFDGYREKDPLSRLQDLTLSALHYDLEDNPLEVRLDPGEQTPSQGDRYDVSVMVEIPFDKLLLVPQAEFHTAQVSLFVIARDQSSGGVSPFRRIDMPIKIPNARILEALTQSAAYPLRLSMKSGRQRISIGVRDHLANIDSTVNLELNVGSESAAAAESSGSAAESSRSAAESSRR